MWALLCVAAFFGGGCQKFAKTAPGKTATSLGSFEQPTVGAVVQSEAPETPTKTETYREEKKSEPTPSMMRRVTEEPNGIKVTEEFIPVAKVSEVKTGTKSEIGAAQKDRAAEVFAAISAMRPVQYVGIALIVFGVACFTYAPLRILVGGGKQLPIMCGAAGGVLIFGPQILAGHERMVIGLVAVGLLVYWLSIRLTRKEAEADLKSGLKGDE